MASLDPAKIHDAGAALDFLDVRFLRPLSALRDVVAELGSLQQAVREAETARDQADVDRRIKLGAVDIEVNRLRADAHTEAQRMRDDASEFARQKREEAEAHYRGETERANAVHVQADAAVKAKHDEADAAIVAKYQGAEDRAAALAGQVVTNQKVLDDIQNEIAAKRPQLEELNTQVDKARTLLADITGEIARLRSKF